MDAMKDETLLVHTARDPFHHSGAVNLPVYRASTILYPTLEAYRRRFEGNARYDGITYGARGTPSTLALAEAVARLEGGHGGVVTATGLSACTQALAAFVQAGDHILLSDSAYGPTRNFCTGVLQRFGVETTFYDPAIGAGIAALLRDTTRVVYVESPGSLTFEVQDVPAIAAAAHARGALVLMDNTWATGLYFKPFRHGVDVSIQAGTKYIAGHSDLVLGIIVARDEALYRRLKDTTGAFGDVCGPDECYLALRGLRTLAVRLKHQEQSGLRVARFLQGRPEVRRVMHPALPEHPGHALWKRDFLGASSLFGVLLHSQDVAAVGRMVDGLRCFQIGSSWGGYESLVAFSDVREARTAVPWSDTPFLLRFHIGLEDPDELIEDLAAGLQRLAG
jgi:cysteine-S-conjugate beta-lyase